MKHLLSMALESLSQRDAIAMEQDVENGKFFSEHEHEFYVELKSMDELLKADSMDMQEQWTIKIPKTDKNAAKGSLRIRKIQRGTVDGGAEQQSDEPAQYVMNTKGDLGPGKRLEVPIPSTVDNFVLFAYLSDSGMIKHRYHFPTEDGLVFEVDMFLNPEGGYYPVCKVDLEVKDKGDEIPDFPFEVNWVINGDTEDREEKAKIGEFYENYFITGNKYGGAGINSTASKLEVRRRLARLRERRQGDDEDPGDHEYRGEYHGGTIIK